MDGPAKIANMVARMKAERERAERLVREDRERCGIATDVAPEEASRMMMVKMLGGEKAAEMQAALASPYRDRAAERRRLVLKLSLEGKLVREIAQELGCSYARVVELRAELGCGRRR